MYYIKHWFSVPLASEAPFTDLALYKDMLEYQYFDKPVANAVLEKLRRHTWYMNMEYAPLSLFSSKVDDKEKVAIAQKLAKVKAPRKYQGGHPTPVDLPKEKKKGMKVCLSQFVGNGSLYMFHVLKFGEDWLSQPISTWKNNPSFLEMEHFVKNLLICNDPAERGIKLVSDYANSLTKNSTEREQLLQVVELQRRQFPDCKKSSLSKSLVGFSTSHNN